VRHVGEGLRLRVRLVFQHRGGGAAEAAEVMSMACELMIVAGLFHIGLN
jgi:hypothetical protein